MTIDKLDALFAKFAPIKKPEPIIPHKVEDKSKASGSEGGFAQMFSDAIKEVDSLQTQAESQIEGLTLGRDGVTTHGAMLALERADTAFQLMSAIRQKIVRAYEDLIRTPI